MKFKKGDKVRLSSVGRARYGIHPTQGTQQGPGVVVYAGPRPYIPPALERPYLVSWDLDPGAPPNSYTEDDLEIAKPSPFTVVEP